MSNEKNFIGPFDPEVIHNQAAQEKVTDKDDATYKTEDPNFFEWWYFDVTTDQGYTIVFIMKDRNYANMQLPPVPEVKIAVESPDGNNRLINKPFPDLKWEASRERCEVKLGDRFACYGAYPTYRIKAEEEDVMLDLEFVATLPGWRPGTGIDYFSADRSKLFGWVVAQPRANVTGTLKIGEKTVKVTGTGYHDHNWGNVPLAGNVARWHWGRTYAGDFTVIFSIFVAGNAYDRKELTVFMLGKGNEILLSSGEMRGTPFGEITTAPETGNRYPEGFVFKIPYKNSFVEMRLTNKKMIDEMDFAPQLPKADNMGKPAYLRFLADLDMTVPFDEGIEKVKGDVVHEYMLLEMTKYD